MKISSLRIQNFRGIRFAELANLGQMVVIAGTNGSGKSTIFDAIRLLKAVYGSFQNNEPDQWFGEFQMPLTNTPDAFLPLFNDKTKPLEIQAEFVLEAAEKDYLRENAKELVEQVFARDFTGYGGGYVAKYQASLSRRFRQYEDVADKYVGEFEQDLLRELEKDRLLAKFHVDPMKVPEIPPSMVLETVFSTNEPQKIGGLRYHSAQRNYAREQLNNVSINVVEQGQADPASYLYGNAQYSNIKQEMATAYVKELVAKDAGVEFNGKSSINATLKELFAKFFPGKEFLGARPNSAGNVYFPVRIGANGQHDLDDLSSGEKEIVYGYLRMRNRSPRYSVVLIDEPELHLNPLLIGGLPDFYHRHLGAGLTNQLWLVTHSDTLLRAALGRSDYSIYHMVSQSAAELDTNQAVKLAIDEQAQDAVHALVGDWAAYRPGAKLVIFEGGGDTDFDVRMTGQLFPETQEKLNFLSAGGRDQARQLHAAVERSDAASDIRRKVFSIGDRDSESDVPSASTNRFVWDRYHIENYLLEPDIIAAVLSRTSSTQVDPSATKENLLSSAKDCIGPLVRHELHKHVHKAFGDLLDVKVDPKASNVAELIRMRIENIPEKLAHLTDGILSKDRLIEVEKVARSKLESDLQTDEWMKSLRGRDILRRFCELHQPGVSYEALVNMILDEMATRGHRPTGMLDILTKIQNA